MAGGSRLRGRLWTGRGGGQITTSVHCATRAASLGVGSRKGMITKSSKKPSMLPQRSLPRVTRASKLLSTTAEPTTNPDHSCVPTWMRPGRANGGGSRWRCKGRLPKQEDDPAGRSDVPGANPGTRKDPPRLTASADLLRRTPVGLGRRHVSDYTDGGNDWNPKNGTSRKCRNNQSLEEAQILRYDQDEIFQSINRHVNLKSCNHQTVFSRACDSSKC